MLSIFLLSLIGIPVTGGFLAKFYVFTAAMKANLVGLTIIGVVNSAIAAYYYLRLIVVMYMREGREEAPSLPLPASVATAVAVSAAITLYLGIWPQRVLESAARSAHDLLH
jgi:NADH-quinone oxidoreductase subunit N